MINQDERIRELEAQVHELERDLIHDTLTGLKTRAFFEEELGVYLEALAHSNNGKRKDWFGFKNVSIIFFDLDDFKKINDTYGHDIGDDVLKAVSKIIQSSLRSGDTAARWGGEELVVSLLGAGNDDAYTKAEEIRRKIEVLNIEKVPDLEITVSGGVASVQKNISVLELIKCADEALYTSKQEGRNRITRA